MTTALIVVVVVAALVVAFVICVGVLVRAVDEIGRVMEAIVNGVLHVQVPSEPAELQDRLDESGQSDMFTLPTVPGWDEWGDRE